MYHSQTVSLTVGAQLIVFPIDSPAPGQGYGSPGPLRQLNEPRVLRNGRDKDYSWLRRSGRQGKKSQTVTHPQPLHPALHRPAVVCLQPPDPVLLFCHVPENGAAGVDLPGEKVDHPQTVGGPSQRQAEPVGHGESPGYRLPPGNPERRGGKCGPAAQHGRQADQQSQNGKAQHREKGEMEQISHVQELAQQGQDQGNDIQNPPSEHGVIESGAH